MWKIKEIALFLEKSAEKFCYGSTTILTSVVEGEVTVEEVNAAMKAAATPSFGYTEEQLVSSDIIGINYGSLFDATQTMVKPMDNGTTEVQTVRCV